jgi:hypothetical protein
LTNRFLPEALHPSSFARVAIYTPNIEKLGSLSQPGSEVPHPSKSSINQIKFADRLSATKNLGKGKANYWRDKLRRLEILEALSRCLAYLNRFLGVLARTSVVG